MEGAIRNFAGGFSALIRPNAAGGAGFVGASETIGREKLNYEY